MRAGLPAATLLVFALSWGVPGATAPTLPPPAPVGIPHGRLRDVRIPDAAKQPVPPRGRPRPPRACGRAVACVDTAARIAWLLDGGRVVRGPVPVSLGRPGQRTPTGSFAVVWKDAEHTSSIYGIPMDYAVFFAAGGIALHEGNVRVASHGCVHLPTADAVAFFERLRPGDPVTVV